MRIAFLTPEYITESNFDGGLANYLFRIATGMSKRGHEVEIFTYSDRNEDYYSDGIFVHRIKVEYGILIRLFKRLTGYKLKKSYKILAFAYCLKKRFLKNHKTRPFDLVQQSSYLTPGLLLLINKKLPIVTRFSSYEPLCRQYYRSPATKDQLLIEFFERFALHRSNANYTPSKLLAGILKENIKLKIDVIRPPFFINVNQTDESIYQKNLSDKKYVLFFGSIGILKGGEVIASCIYNILSKNKDMYFVFVGKVFSNGNGQPMLDYIKERAGMYSNRIIYLGVLKHTQLYPIIKNAQTIVLPSLIDNFPNAMLESMALGKVVIGTSGASFEELIENEISGILIEPNNESALSEAVQKIWDMKTGEIDEMGRAAKQKIQSLSPDIACEQLESYFDKILEK